MNPVLCGSAATHMLGGMTIVALLLSGLVGAPFVAFLISLVALPVSHFVVALLKERPEIPTWPVVTVSLFQTYPSLTWVLLIQEYSRWRLANVSGVMYWLTWMVGLVVAHAPAMRVLRLAAKDQASGNIQNFAAPFTVAFTTVGYVVLIFAPEVRRALWPWLPFWFE